MRNLEKWLFSMVLLLLSPIFVSTARAANPIQLENAKPGTTDWQITNYALNHEVEGYASVTSVNRGGQIQFFVNTADRNFTIEIFRTGWYSGMGGRRITSAVQLAGTAQPPCPTTDQSTGLIECNWTNPYVLQVPNDTADPTDWASGVYLAKLTGASGKQAYIVFTVRDDSRPSSYLFQNSVNTYQAYNNWGGRSLYASNSDYQARKVSFNRPYADSQGTGQYLGSYEYPMVRFLEREGYDVTYATDLDVHEDANLLLSHNADLIAGHGEYWSWEMRSHVITARDQGMSLGIFAANTCYWQVRFEPSGATGAADRILVGYKDYALTEDPDYINGDTSKYYLVTTKWRANPVNLPEDAFIGVMFGSDVSTGDIIVNDASNWVFNNTGLQNGSHLANLIGDEVDNLAADTPPGTVLLSHSPYQLNGSTLYSDMTVYTVSSGATVFAAGTIIWSWGLDGYNGGTVSAAAQQMTRNLLARFAGEAQLTVSLSSVTVSPTSISGGGSSTGTVTLSEAAPSGGATVRLTSSNTSVAQVPASVTVSAGARSATFTITTSDVAGVATVSITANYIGGSKIATLTVNPVSVSGQIAFVQQKAATYSSTAAVIVTLNTAPQPGSALVLFSANNKVSVSEVSGSGVTWARGVLGGGHSDIEIWYGLNSSGSGTAITVSYNGTGSGGVNVSEFSGVATSNAVDVAPLTNAGISTNPITPTAVASNANDLIVGAAADTSVAATTAGPTNSFIALTEAANTNKIVPAYRIVRATGSYSTGWTEGNGGWDSAIVALKAAGTSTGPSLSSVTLTPTSVTGGTSSTGSVTLSGAAPTGGATVSLSSSNTTSAQVPAAVTISAGSTTATFKVTTSAVGSVTTLAITGTYNGGTQTATLRVNLAATVSLSSVSLNPTSVTGRTSSTGTVTLSGAAPTGGASVSLSSNNTMAAQVPASVSVSAGSTTATFTVTTSSVASVTAVTITGSYNSGTKTAALNVNPVSVSGQISFVQQKTATYSSAASVVAKLGAAPHPGSALVLFSANNNVNITGVSGGGVTWVRASASSSHSVAEIWYGLNSSGSGTAITVTYTNATGSGGVNVSEFSGVASSKALDAVPAPTTGISTSPTTPITITNNANDLILAAAADTSVGATAAGPINSFIALTEAVNSNKIIPAYRIVSATGSYNTSWTEPNTGWDAVIVALK
jgi:hypothetical protein